MWTPWGSGGVFCIYKEMFSFQEPLYCRGPGEMSCIERCPHIRNPFTVDTGKLAV